MLGDTIGQHTGKLGAGQRTESPGLWDSEEKPSGGAVYAAVGGERVGPSEAFSKVEGLPECS